MQVLQINCDSYIYEAARKKMKSALLEKGVDISNYNTQFGLINKYELIENGKVSLKFDLKRKAGGFNSEYTVVENDVFIPVGIALGFIKTPLIADGKFESIENQEIIFFNSETVFNYTKSGSVSQSKALGSIYHARVSIVNGGETLVPEFPARFLKRVPKGKVDGLYNYEGGVFHHLTEFPVLNGGNTNVVKFDVPSADTTSASGDIDKERTYGVLMFVGFNIVDLAKDLSGHVKCI